MKKIKTKKAVYNKDFTECLEIGWIGFSVIEPFLPTCSKVPDKLPENIISLFEAFYGNESKTITGIENWDTSNITHMNTMFSNCNNLIELDLSKWNTKNVIYMHTMFNSCVSLTKLDISNFSTKNLVNINFMFYGCFNLITIDMFKINDELETRYILSGCDKLENINFKSRTIILKIAGMR